MAGVDTLSELENSAEYVGMARAYPQTCLRVTSEWAESSKPLKYTIGI